MSYPLILAYHRVHPDAPNDTLAVTPGAFRRQVLFLIARGYSVLTLTEWLKSGAAQNPKKTLIITFDDGWTDNYDYAFPVMQELGISGTIFLVSDYIDIDSVPKVMGPAPGRAFLSSERIIEMHEAGMDFGSHTATHPVLPDLSEERIAEELSRSKEALGRLLGTEIKTLCYPKSRATAKILRAASDCGYEAGLLTRPFSGDAPVDKGPMALPRVGVYGSDNHMRFLLKYLFSRRSHR